MYAVIEFDSRNTRHSGIPSKWVESVEKQKKKKKDYLKRGAPIRLDKEEKGSSVSRRNHGSGVALSPDVTIITPKKDV